MEVCFKVPKDFGCIIFTCLSMELMDGGVLISPDSACLILNDVLEGSVGALDGWESVLFGGRPLPRSIDEQLRKVMLMSTGFAKGRGTPEPAFCVLDFNR